MAAEKVNHNVKIRNYKPEDLEACRELWVQLTEWHRHIYNSQGIGVLIQVVILMNIWIG